VKINSADFQKGGFSEEESLEVVRWPDGEGIDLLEISRGNYESPALLLGPGLLESTVAREAYFLEFARRVRGVTRLPLMVTGGFRSAAAMEAALEDGLDPDPAISPYGSIARYLTWQTARGLRHRATCRPAAIFPR
jgi:2,4-dienoyl-CoA reductase-like NADH-dependent reductase (Old Yellow Enzyme family)